MLSSLEQKSRPLRGAAVALFGLFTGAASWATQIMPPDIKPIDDLFSRAPIAIEGEVLGHRDQYKEEVGTLTIWQIEVLEVFKDTASLIKPASVIEFQTMGSVQQDTSALTIADVGPPIQDGMQVILFLQRAQEGCFQLFELRTTAFFEVAGDIAHRAILDHFLPHEFSADSLRDCFREAKSASRIHDESK